MIQERTVISRFGLPNQHQGLDAVLEEVNKALKSLIPPISSQRHWKIAARNCTKFMKLRTNLFNTIGYSEGEIHRPRTRPDFAIESRRFRVQIRKTQFIDSNQNFQNITGEWMLSEELKKFSEIAHKKRAEFIKAVLIDKSPLGIWHPIPITRDEADFQQSEISLTKTEILTIINSLIPSLDDSNQLRFRSLSSKSRDNLLNILQEIRNILAENNIIACEEIEN